MAFNTKLRFSCAKFYQCSGDTMSLSGSTSVGSLAYLSAPTITNARDITDKAYVDGCDAYVSGITLANANSYTDTCAATTLSSAQSYADGCDAYVSGITLTAAQSYADGCDAYVSGITLSAANSYTDTCAATTLSSAQSYADGCDAYVSGITLSNANSYTDTCAATTLSSAQSYADGCDAYVSGITLTAANSYTDTCVANCTITANNGLHKDGNNIHLGGTLTGATTICHDGNAFCVCNGDANGTVYATATGAGLQMCSNNMYTVAAASCMRSYHLACTDDVSIQTSSNGTLSFGFDTSSVRDYGSSPQGLQYAACYSTGFTSNCSLVDKGYVDSASGAIGGSNGLSRQSDNIVLGGALTGLTTISGSQTLCLSSLTAFNATATNIALTGIVGVTGVFSTTTTATIGGALTLSSVGTGSVSDSVLTVTAGGVVQKISSSSLGEDNNLYATSGTTSGITLTDTYYAVMANSTGGSFTITLPAAPAVGQAYKIKDSGLDALSNNITIDGNTNLIDGVGTATINTDGGALELVWDGTQWNVLSFVN